MLIPISDKSSTTCQTRCTRSSAKWVGINLERPIFFFVFLVFINNTFLPLLCGELDEKKPLKLSTNCEKKSTSSSGEKFINTQCGNEYHVDLELLMIYLNCCFSRVEGLCSKHL